MAEQGYDAIEPDVALFIDRATWFGRERKMTVYQFLDWFTGYLDVEDRRFILEALPFFHKEHQKAEKILCTLLETDFRNKQKVRTIRSHITRNTDWPRTYVKAFPLAPQKYYQVETHLIQDNVLLGILADIAYGWAGIARNLVALFDQDEQNQLDIQNLVSRAINLEKAVHAVQTRGVRIHARPLSTQYRQVIMRVLKPEEHKLFLNILNYWVGNDLEPTIKNLTALIRKQTQEDKYNNLETLFETTCHLCILYAAIENGWQLKIETKETKRKTPAKYHLKKDKRNFILGKGNPKNLFIKSPYTHPENKSDRMLALRELAGITGTGYEPDIVMGFYKDEQEDAPIVIFGDAKRYGKSDIAFAYKETVSSTMIAYGHWGGLQIDTSASWNDAFRSPVSPFFTLFYVKNTKNKQIFPSPREQREKEKSCPPIIAIELEYMNENPEEMDLWFQEIENKVSKHIP